MSEPRSKTFDCVQTMRQARDRFSAEIADMSHDELVKWLRDHRYADTLLQRLAGQAAQADKDAEVVSIWLIPVGEDVPRFITAHPGARK